MKITSVITTVRHNIGDDFVRDGILDLLHSIGKLDSVELIHKHVPLTNFYGFQNVRADRFASKAERLLRTFHAPNRVNNADLLVQSGAPVYWCHPEAHCVDNEWFDPFITKQFLPQRRGRAFISLAGGSCQRYHSDGTDLCERCKAYMRDFYDACNLTMLRDQVARKMLNVAGRDAEVLPCTSIFARDRLKLRPEAGEYVVLNFMENGGHFTFGQDINAEGWRKQFIKLANAASQRDRVILACHTPGEEQAAKALLPDIERFLIPNEYTAFMQFYSRAKWGILNRVHGAFMMASFGKPVVVVGNDTRALMIQNLGLSSYYVNDAIALDVDSVIDEVATRCKTYPAEVESVRDVARSKYQEKLRSVLGP